MRSQLLLIMLFCVMFGQKSVSQNSKFSIEGKIIDYVSEEAIIGASIVTDSVKKGAFSDIRGDFKIEGHTSTLDIYFIGYYPIRFINLPSEHGSIDFGKIRLVQNHRSYDGIGVPSEPISDDLIKKDKKIKQEVLKKYRFRTLGTKLKPCFDGNYFVFDFKKLKSN